MNRSSPPSPPWPNLERRFSHSGSRFSHSCLNYQTSEHGCLEVWKALMGFVNVVSRHIGAACSLTDFRISLRRDSPDYSFL